MSLRKRCHTLDKEESLSIGKQIVPAKTKRSGIRQYNPRKPVEWGFKMYVLAGVSGVMYDFFLYCGANSTKFGDSSTRSCALELCETIPMNQNYKLFFDNWFSTLSLCVELKNMGILTTATLRKDRLGKCPLSSTKEMTGTGRGPIDYRVDMNTGLPVVKWLDNGEVHLVSIYDTVEPVSEVERWDKRNKQYIQVSCPSIVKS